MKEIKEKKKYKYPSARRIISIKKLEVEEFNKNLDALKKYYGTKNVSNIIVYAVKELVEIIKPNKE